MFTFIMFLAMVGALVALCYFTFVHEPFIKLRWLKRTEESRFMNDKFSQSMFKLVPGRKRPDDDLWEQLREHNGFMKFTDAQRVWQNGRKNGTIEGNFFADGSSDDL